MTSVHDKEDAPHSSSSKGIKARLLCQLLPPLSVFRSNQLLSYNFYYFFKRRSHFINSNHSNLSNLSTTLFKMQFTSLLTSSLLLVASSSAVSAASIKPERRLSCGGAPDASLSDCKNLVANWPALNYDQKCHYAFGLHDAFNPVALGACNVYVDQNNVDSDTLKAAVQQIIGCQGASTVNGVTTVGNGARVCISDGTGCSDCFN